MSLKVEVIVGTYEEFLLGYKIVEKDDKTVLTQSFADKSHSATIKCLAVKGEWIATGAGDDRIFIYNMRLRKQSQIILSHEGTINALSFTPDETHLLSGGDDGQMVATRLKTWFTEAAWKKAHNGTAVTHICCHPSGKLALSLGADLVLRTWNLVKGRIAYKTNLKSRNTLGSMPDCLAWSLAGDYFSISGQRLVEIWSIKTADVVLSHKTKSKPICVAWVTNESCLIGLEDGNILWLTLNEEEQKENLISAHNARVKAMYFYKDILATTSSSGEVKVWYLDVKQKKLKEVASTNIGCRPTCIALLDLEQFGPNYVLTNKIAEKQEIIVEKKSINKQKPRGIVTIEYENEDENIPKQDVKKHNEKKINNPKKRRHEESDEEEDNDDDSVENDDDDIDDEEEDEVDDDDDDEEDEVDDEEDEIDEDDDNENDLSDNDDNTSEEDSTENDTPFKSVKNNQNNAKRSKLVKNSKDANINAKNGNLYKKTLKNKSKK